VKKVPRVQRTVDVSKRTDHNRFILLLAQPDAGMRRRLPHVASRGITWAIPSFIVGFIVSSFLSSMRDVRNTSNVVGPAQAAAAAAAARKSPIHIIQAFCSYSWEFEHGHNGMTSVRSILVAREGGTSRDRPYVFHIIADDPVTNAIQKGLNYNVSGRSDAAATLMNRFDGWQGHAAVILCLT
jgi:hypothetical protein